MADTHTCRDQTCVLYRDSKGELIHVPVGTPFTGERIGTFTVDPTPQPVSPQSSGISAPLIIISIVAAYCCYRFAKFIQARNSRPSV
jgi:hypothetical protein